MHKLILIIFFFFLNFIFLFSNDLEKGRDLFNKASYDENNLKIALEYFDNLKLNNKDVNLNNLINIYIGSLTTTKAKFYFMPNKKYEYATKGIVIMEEHLSKNSTIEEMFVYAITCEKLPFFFNKSEVSKQYYEKILNKLQNNISHNDLKESSKLIGKILDYLKYKTKFKEDLANKVDVIYKNYFENVK